MCILCQLPNPSIGNSFFYIKTRFIITGQKLPVRLILHCRIFPDSGTRRIDYNGNYESVNQTNGRCGCQVNCFPPSYVVQHSIANKLHTYI